MANPRLIRFALTSLALVFVAGCPQTTPKPMVAPPKPPPPEPGRFEKRFDKARGMTLLRLRPATPPPPGRSLALVAAGGFPGHHPVTYTGVLLGLRSADRRFHLMNCKSVGLRVNGNSLGDFGATRETEIGAGWLAEYVLAVVPFTRAFAFASAAQGAELEVVACDAKHRLEGVELKRLRELLSALTPAR